MKTLREINIGAAEMWAYDLNGDMTPDNVSGYSEQEAWFRCSDNPKHLFKKRIGKMTSDRDGHNIGCKYCGPNAKEAFPGETDFFTKVPEAADLWDFDQNDSLGLDAKKLLPYSSKKAHFVCNNGHDEFRKISDFTKAPQCQTCLKLLLIGAPQTHLFLNQKYNTTENIRDYINTDRRMIELACPNCKYTWSWRADLWWKRQYCPHCGYDGTKGSCEKNSFVKKLHHIVTLRDANPEMAAVWDYEKNGDATPDNTRGQTNKKYFFKCDNGHAFNIVLQDLYDKDRNPLGCPFCNGAKKRLLKGTTDLVSQIPEILNFWDFDNNDVPPTDLTKSSRYEANFKCNKGHSFKRKVCQFTVTPICPECRIIENAEKNSIKNLRPESYRFWDFEKNSLDPSVTSIYLQKEAFWKCPDCGYEWIQKISNRCTAMEGKCPSHDMKREFSEGYGVKYRDSFCYKNPVAASFWNIKLSGGMCPEKTPKSSTKEIYMNCSRGKHKPYRIRVCDIRNLPYGCPECVDEDRRNSYRKYSLKINIPCVIDMWDYTDNEICLDDAKIYMSRSANFICNNGHRFSRPIKIFAQNQNCPICGIDSVARHPKLVRQWDFKKNEQFDINVISVKSSEEVWWRCKKCGYGWQSQIKSRNQSAGHCPCCEERTVVVSNVTDLFTIFPDIKEFYDFEMNKDIDPAKLSVTSSTQINWKCDICGYKWRTGVGARIIAENGTYKVRPCPSCTGQVRTKSYGEDYPELAEQFEVELNNCSLYDIIGSKFLTQNYYWKCNICDEVFETSIASMIRGRNAKSKGCLYCAGKKVTRENSFAALHPEVMDEFDPANEIDPYAVTERSYRTAKWICRNNPEHTWNARFYARANGQGGCNICRGYNYDLMFFEEHSEFEQYYDTENNDRPFNSYSNSSNKYVWWRCSKKHSFKWPINRFSSGGIFRCPICNNKQLLVGENDLKSQYPDLAQEFDVDKNNIRPEDMLYTNTDASIWWICTEGHSFQRSVWYRVNYVRECPICNRTIVVKGVNDFQTKYPRITSIWDYEANDRTPDTISDRNSDKYSFKCKKGHRYQALLKTVKINHFKCLICSYKIIQPGTNSLEDTDEALSREWSPNESRKPHEFHKYSKYSVLWKCPTCHGDYLYPINQRKVGDNTCPYCNNRRILIGFNSLLDKDMELAKEWSQNNELLANQVLRTSSNYGLWNCPTCHGEYSYRIKERYVGDNCCPYCNNKRVLPGYNSLKAKYSNLLKEWNYRDNYLIAHPDSILPTYLSDVWWTCICGKNYKMSPKKRVYYLKRHMTACPYCKGRRRKKYRHF